MVEGLEVVPGGSLVLRPLGRASLGAGRTEEGADAFCPSKAAQRSAWWGLGGQGERQICKQVVRELPA